PMADIQVLWRPESGAWSLRLAGRPLEIATDGRVGRSVYAKTDAQGCFRLPVASGEAGACVLVDAAGHVEPLVPACEATAPATVSFVVHDEIRVRVIRAGRPV